MNTLNLQTPIRIQPAVRKETTRITAGTILGTLVMYAVFLALHRTIPSFVPFDCKVIISGILGAAFACGNFFLMGITVQKAADAATEKEAYRTVKASYRFRTFLLLLWTVLALSLPFLNGAAGIIPLFLPGFCIKAGSILGIIK